MTDTQRPVWLDFQAKQREEAVRVELPSPLDTPEVLKLMEDGA